MSPKEKTNFKSSDKICLVLGNEGHGVLKSTEILTDGVLNIKTENVESLNVSAAVAIAMYKIRGGF
jgi:tRNA G18 (ribose-2'-O)-methylase SpoU